MSIPPPITLDALDRYQTIQDYWQHDATQDQLDALISEVESAITTQVTKFACHQYYYHEQTGIWGEVGEDASRSSFMHMLLGLDEEIPITMDYQIEFETRLKNLYEIHQVAEILPTTIPEYLKHYKFQILGIEFQLQDSEALNRLFKFIGSTLSIQSGDYGDEREIILGRGIRSQFDEYSVVDLTSEIMRTANIVTSLAAAIGQNQIFIRRVSLSGIFQLKWESFIQYPYPATISPEYLAGHRLKQLTCAAYKIDSDHTLKAVKSQFLQDMRENILFHELGHAVIQHRVLPEKIATFSEASKLIPHPLIHGLLELLAEIAPQNGEIQGPIANILTIAQSVPERAMRMYWMYVSDTWFFDTPDEYMYFYSDLVAITFCAPLRLNGTIDFKMMSTLIWGPSGIFERAKDCVISACSQLINILETNSYPIDGSQYSYTNAVEHFQQTILTEGSIQPTSSHQIQTALWHELLAIAIQNEVFLDRCNQILTYESSNLFETLAQIAGFPTQETRATIISKLIDIKSSD